MENQPSPSVKTIVPVALMLAVIGWLGIVGVIYYSLPTVGPRWLFFFFSVLAITGTFLPLVAYFNHRFPSKPPVNVSVILRQTLWIGIYIPTLAWLQIARVLTIGLAVILAVSFVILEGLLRLRERSRWKPRQEDVHE
ncbi:MAG: hypothetical protein JW908_07700 [Anaerolineales bacterium]|nr:hypothetical protein [Anaerolineales bacterium]